MKALFDSLVRTFTPIIVGTVLGWFVAAGITVDPEFEKAFTLLISAVLSGVYYVGVRLLETYVTPRFGWLLGLAKQPDYFKRVKVVEDGQSFTVRVDGPDVEQVADLSTDRRYNQQ